MRGLSLFALIFNLLFAGIWALDPADPNAKAGYFVYYHGDLEYVVGINAVDNGDIYIHMSAPEEKQWMGVGIGSQMKDSLMIISYKSSNGTGITTNPRIADGHNEPNYDSSYSFEKIWSDAYAPFSNSVANGIMIMHGVCRNCSTWTTGALDVKSTTQPFIFAVGPGKSLSSDSATADLSRHELYGSFTMDMTQATSSGSGRVPAPNIANAGTGDNAFKSSGTSAAEGVKNDRDFAPSLHALTMLAAFVLVFPFGALVLRLIKKVMWHAAVQIFGFALVLIGFGAAIRISREYNRSENFSSAHQIIGLFVFACLFIQIGLGMAHHEMYKRTKRPTILGRTHLLFGPVILVLAIVNGGIGFNFAADSHLHTPYIIVVIIVAVLFAVTRAFLHYCNGPRKYRPDYVESATPWTETPVTPWSATPLRRAESDIHQSPETPYSTHSHESYMLENQGYPYPPEFQYGSAGEPEETRVQTLLRSWKNMAKSGM